MTIEELTALTEPERARGYLDFERLYALDQAGGFFITRAKRNLDARRVYSAPVDCDTGLICDQTVALNGFYAAPVQDHEKGRISFDGIRATSLVGDHVRRPRKRRHRFPEPIDSAVA